MKWYIPSWNGDLRLEEAGSDKTELSIVKPTAQEVKVLGEMKTQFIDKDWIKAEDWKEPSRWRKRKVTINAPLVEVGALSQKLMKPGGAVMTAVVMSDGEVTTHCRATPEKDDEEIKDKVSEAKESGATAAATVKRPTPCCPQCLPGAVEPANEVLQQFLTEEQHETWAEDRSMIVVGGMSGHEYLLVHRKSLLAGKIGRICFDLTDGAVVHFHDWTVPPEEEVLAAKLILEHAEDWLRNDATLWDAAQATDIFDNPFGDIYDGVMDAYFTQGVGLGVAAMGKLPG